MMPTGMSLNSEVPLTTYFGERAAGRVASRRVIGRAGSAHAGRPIPTMSVEWEDTACAIPARVRKPPVTMMSGGGVGRVAGSMDRRREIASDAKEMKKASRATLRAEGVMGVADWNGESLSSPSIASEEESDAV